MHSENVDGLLLLQALFTIIENSGLAFVRKWQVYEYWRFFSGRLDNAMVLQ